MDSNVNATTQIKKYVTPNSGEPFVVETKTTTTTTTTTVTKRICVPKDVNVDLTEIQSLLDDDNLTKINEAIDDAVPPKVNVTANSTTKPNQNATTVDTSKRVTQNKKRNAKQNTTLNHLSEESPLLSSTKIGHSINSSKSSTPNKSSNLCNGEKQQPTTAIVRSPNLSKISTSSNGNSSSKNKGKNKNVTKKNSKSKSAAKIIVTKKSNKKPIKSEQKNTNKNSKLKQMDAPNGRRSLRSTALRNQQPNYIDDLINQYISLEKKPARKKKPKPPVEKPSVQEPPPPFAEVPSIELHDLSAIYENSIEEEASIATDADTATNTETPLAAPDSISSINFADEPAADNVDYDIELDDYQLPLSSSVHDSPTNEQLPIDATDVEMPLKQDTKSNRPKRKLLKTTGKKAALPSKIKKNASKSVEKIITKVPTTKKATTKATTKKPIQSIGSDSTTSAINPSTNETTAANIVPESLIRSTTNYSPIKIYSPSHRTKFRSSADNKLLLTKRVVARKLQNLPTPSKKILDRFNKAHPIDANSRLIYYPNNDGDDDGQGAINNHSVDVNSKENMAASNNKGKDFLQLLKQKRRPLLVKEIDG